MIVQCQDMSIMEMKKSLKYLKTGSEHCRVDKSVSPVILIDILFLGVSVNMPVF